MRRRDEIASTKAMQTSFGVRTDRDLDAVGAGPARATSRRANRPGWPVDTMAGGDRAEIPILAQPGRPVLRRRFPGQEVFNRNS
jgi:hypothetical protein